MRINMQCLCHSGKAYAECCQPFHEGRAVPNPLLLMRSRYAAYALQLPEYIIKTTHRDHPSFKEDHQQWSKEILEFCRKTKFEDLEICDFNEEEATVSFVAHLKGLNDEELSFFEKSGFKKEGQQWLYRASLEWRKAHKKN